MACKMRLYVNASLLISMLIWVACKAKFPPSQWRTIIVLPQLQHTKCIYTWGVKLLIWTHGSALSILKMSYFGLLPSPQQFSRIPDLWMYQMLQNGLRPLTSFECLGSDKKWLKTTVYLPSCDKNLKNRIWYNMIKIFLEDAPLTKTCFSWGPLIVRLIVKDICAS